jgi:hypothetical protein
MGLRPMPGIISVDITSRSAYGSLREATVKYLVHTKRELEDLEILFMRPGHHVMLEWGWSMYLDTYVNDSGSTATSTNGNRLAIGNLKVKNFIEPTIDAFKEELVHFDIINKIEAFRHKFSGNYDGMVGPVRNFEFKLLENGSYECTTVIISLGDVLDSLKMSSTGLPVDSNKQTEQQRLATKFESLFLPLLTLNQLSSYNTNVTAKNILTGGFLVNTNSNYTLDPNYFINTIIGQDTYQQNLLDTTDTNSFDNIDFQIRKISFKNPPDDLIFKGVSVQGSLHYMSMGAFIVAMSSQFNLFDPRKSGNVPMINIEIPYPDYGQYGNGLCLMSQDTVSIDPGVCVVKNSNAQFVTGTQTGFVMSDMNNFREFNYLNTKNLGIIGNIYLCVEYIIKKFRSLALSSDGYVDFKQFIIEILKDCSYSLGGINQFDMFATDATVAILDIHYVEADSTKKSKYQMNILGTNSVIKDFNISSKIFASQAAMIAIAAQDRENVAGMQSSTFNYLNRGLSDRLILQKLTKEEALKAKASNQETIASQSIAYRQNLIDTTSNLQTYFKSILSGDLSQVAANKEAAQSNLNTVILKIDNDTNYKAVIPIGAELTIDGMSGLTQGEIFTINPDSLPREYVGSNLGFIITRINSTIKASTWETTISTQCCVLEQDKITPALGKINKQDILKGIADKQQQQQQQINQQNLQQVYIYNYLIKYIVDYFGAINQTSLNVINNYLPQTNIFAPGLAQAAPLYDINSFVYEYDINFENTADIFNTLKGVVTGPSLDYGKLQDPLKSKLDSELNDIRTALVNTDITNTDKSPTAILVLVYQLGNNILDLQQLFVKTRNQ